MSVNYDRVCRLCLSSRGELLPIFPTTSPDDTGPPVLASKIKDCVSVQINENDDLPTNVCRKCMNNVNNWHIFKTVCERTQNKLQSLIKKDGSLLEEVKVKSEPFSDELYDGVVIDGSYPDSENAAGPSSKVQPEGPPILASLGLTPRSDKKYVDPRMDWHRVHAILDMVQDDEVIDSLQSTEESDVLLQSDHDSDTDAELKSDIDDDFIDCKNGYICKNKKIIYKTSKLSTAANLAKITEVVNLRKRKTKLQKHCSQPITAWQMLFTDDLLEMIVLATNENISKNCKSISSSTSVSEIKTLIGILYLHGIMRPTHQKCTDLWHNDYGILCMKRAMKYVRFKFLLENLSFFNQQEDDSIIHFDIMKRMRQVFEMFAMNCRNVFDTKNVMVIDEIIVPVYGPCPFRYEIIKKSLKCGIKMVLLVDPSNFYVSNLDVITDPYFAADEIVQKLVQHLSGTGSTVIMDSWFTSLSLMDKLKNEFQLYSIAALNPNDDIIPPLFLTKHRKCRENMTGFLDDDITLTSYVNSESKSVNILTNEPKLYKRGVHTAASVYKKNQSAVEVLDVLMHYYTTMQNTNNWTLSLFFTLLNIASINAQVIWSSQNTSNVGQRRLFIKDLAISLLLTDPMNESVVSPMKRAKYSIFQDIIVTRKSRSRCRICTNTTKRDRRTKQYCVKCGQHICKEHAVIICTMCG